MMGHVCNFKTLCTFGVVQFIVEIFANFDVVFLQYSYFTKMTFIIT